MNKEQKAIVEELTKILDQYKTGLIPWGRFAGGLARLALLACGMEE